MDLFAANLRQTGILQFVIKLLGRARSNGGKRKEKKEGGWKKTKINSHGHISSHIPPSAYLPRRSCPPTTVHLRLPLLPSTSSHVAKTQALTPPAARGGAEEVRDPTGHRSRPGIRPKLHLLHTPLFLFLLRCSFAFSRYPNLLPQRPFALFRLNLIPGTDGPVLSRQPRLAHAPYAQQQQGQQVATPGRTRGSAEGG